MAVGGNKGPGRKRRRKRPAVKGGPTRLVPPPAPAPGQGDGAGVMHHHEAEATFHPHLIESDEGRPFGPPGPVMTLITVLGLIFIVIIAWFIHDMGPPTP